MKALAAFAVLALLGACATPATQTGEAGYKSPNTPDPRNVRFHKHNPPTQPPRTGLHVHGSASVGVVKVF